MLDISAYLTKKKKNGGIPENDNNINIDVYSKCEKVLVFSSDTYFIDIKLNVNI